MHVLNFVSTLMLSVLGSMPQNLARNHSVSVNDVIIQDQVIELSGLPPHRMAYNPSILPHKDGALLFFRVDGIEGYYETRIGAVALNSAFEQVGAISLLDLRPPGMHEHRAEDPRAIEMGQDIYLIYNTTFSDGREYPRGLSIARLDVTSEDDGGVVVSAASQARLLVPPGYPQLPVEKNWTPFIYQQQLHFIYATNPPHVMRLPDRALEHDYTAYPLIDVSREAPEIAFAGGHMRGGTPALWDDENQDYVAFFHSKFMTMNGYRQKYHATIGFYTFAPAPPFAITHVLDEPITPQGLHNDDTVSMSCAYPGGFIRRDNSYYLVYGWQDKSIHVTEIDATRLNAWLRPVN